MNTLKQLLAVAAVIVSPLVVTLPASAVTDGSISNTGPGSNNTIVDNSNFSCKIENDNKIVVTGTNSQTGVTGNGTVTGNTEGGDATSGSASNSNGAEFEVSIVNGEDGSSCEVTKASVPVAATPTQPVNGLGAAGGSGAGAVAAAAPRPTVLPKTSGENFALVGLAIAGVLAAVAAGARGLNLLQNRR